MERVSIVRVVLVTLTVWCGSLAVVVESRGDEAPTSPVALTETFQDYSPGAFPSRWKVRGSEATARAVYRVVEEDGNRFLHAYANKQDVQIGLEHRLQPRDYPVLRWRWRATKLPRGANERVKATNDSAAAVYVVFDNRILPRAIKYVWSASLPAGTQFDSPVYWRGKVVVLQHGPAAAGEWREETVNYYEDYKEMFGFEPGEVVGIALLTDSDAVESEAEAAYDDFRLLPATPPALTGRERAAVGLLSNWDGHE